MSLREQLPKPGHRTLGVLGTAAFMAAGVAMVTPNAYGGGNERNQIVCIGSNLNDDAGGLDTLPNGCGPSPHSVSTSHAQSPDVLDMIPKAPDGVQFLLPFLQASSS